MDRLPTARETAPDQNTKYGIAVPDDEPLTLDDLQRQLLLQQIALFSQANPDPRAQADYVALADAVNRLEVPAALIPRLTAIVEICLSGDRLRRTAGPGAHLALSALFQKTPRGKALAAQVNSLNAALAQLKDQPLAEISAAQRGPGIYTLTLGTPACRMVIRFEADGVRVESLEVGSE
jgi:hypothetical protein